MPKFVELFRAPFTSVWFVLMAATLLSFSLGSLHGPDSSRVSAIAVLMVAFMKVRLVGIHFMELRDAPVVLRSIFEGYALGVCAVLIGFYMLA